MQRSPLKIGLPFTWPRHKAPPKKTLHKLALQKDRGRKPQLGRERPSYLCGFARRTVNQARKAYSLALAKARPDPDFRYFSNARARSSSVNAM